MSHPDLEKKLTPAARNALEELLEDYHAQILQGAEEAATRATRELHEISVRDIVESVHRVRRGVDVRRQSVVEKALNTYVFAGLTLGVGGLAYYFFQQALVADRFVEQLPVLLAVAGFMLAFLAHVMLRVRRFRSYALLTTRSAREDDTEGYGSLFLRYWRDIELSLRDLAAATFGESVASEPVSSLIRKLEQTDFLSSSDSTAIMQLLQIRNAIAHGQSVHPTTSLHAAAEEAARLAGRLVGMASGRPSNTR